MKVLRENATSLTILAVLVAVMGGFADISRDCSDPYPSFCSIGCGNTGGSPQKCFLDFQSKRITCICGDKFEGEGNFPNTMNNNDNVYTKVSDCKMQNKDSSCIPCNDGDDKTNYDLYQCKYEVGTSATNTLDQAEQGLTYCNCATKQAEQKRPLGRRSKFPQILAQLLKALQQARNKF